MTAPLTCAAFEAGAEDLALGFSPSPERDDLVAHASRCADCAALLHELTAVADALLELAPSAEPPAGFEARALAAMRPPVRRRPMLRIGAIAATLVVVAGLAALALARADGPPMRTTRAEATIEGTSGPIGRVELVAAPSAKVVVLLEDDSWSGVWVCELEDDDGAWVEVGRWTAEEASGGAWATTVDRSLLDATRMRITSASGAVIATSGRLQ